MRNFCTGLLTLALAAALGCDSSSTSPTTVMTTCGHRVDQSIVALGENVVLNEAGVTQAPQGQPIQDGWTLARSAATITVHNEREYARIAAFMMPIRDALICDLAATTLAAWQNLTAILRINNIKTVQDLSGPLNEQVYSTDGIYEHLTTDGADENAMLKYLEEAELELKCLAFVGFDFTNPDGANHCVTHGLAQGSGLVIP